jgi:hypothetical protein
VLGVGAGFTGELRKLRFLLGREMYFHVIARSAALAITTAASRTGAGANLRCLEGLIQIPKDIVQILKTDRKPHQLR